MKQKILAFSLEDVKKVCSGCRTCAEQKPIFSQQTKSTLIKSTKPMERLSVDFKGPLESENENKYLFIAVDEFSRFPFAVPCPDTSATSVIRSLNTIFSLCGYPAYIHSDRAAAFSSQEVQDFLRFRGVAQSASTPYHPTGNA